MLSRELLDAFNTASEHMHSHAIDDLRVAINRAVAALGRAEGINGRYLELAQDLTIARDEANQYRLELEALRACEIENRVMRERLRAVAAIAHAPEGIDALKYVVGPSPFEVSLPPTPGAEQYSDVRNASAYNGPADFAPDFANLNPIE